jgi:hypothetical protein
MSRRMKTLRKNDPKEYWKILNTGKSTKQPDIEFKELFNFFKDLNTLKEKCFFIVFFSVIYFFRCNLPGYNFFFRFNFR